MLSEMGDERSMTRDKRMERMCNVVRSGDGVLWLGAGCSVYAGYPSGKQLSALFREEGGDPAEGGEDSLEESSEQFVREHGNSRVELLNVLRGAFSTEPVDTHVHDMLRSIPQLRVLVTTNFDGLIERSLEREVEVVATDEECSARGGAGRTLYKVHGDTGHMRSMVITKSDFDGWMERSESPLWTMIRSFLISRSVIFAGYSMADRNVRQLFAYLRRYLGQFSKEHFVVAPGWDKDVVEALPEGVTYVDIAFEDFVLAVRLAVRENAIEDFERGWMNQEDLGRVLGEEGLRAAVWIGGSVRVAALSLRSGASPSGVVGQGKVMFSRDEGVEEDVRRLLEGRSFEAVEIPPKLKPQVEAWIGDIRVTPKPASEIGESKLRIEPIPVESVNVEMISDDGVDRLEGVRYSRFGSPHGAKLRFEYDVYCLEMVLAREGDGSVNVSARAEDGHLARKGFRFYSMMKRIFEGSGFRLVFDDGREEVQLPELTWRISIEAIEGFGELIEVFADISRIEEHFRIGFGRISLADGVNLNRMRTVLELIDNGRIRIGKMVGIDVNVTNVDGFRDLLTSTDTIALRLRAEKSQVIQLFGRDLDFGPYEVLVPQAVVENRCAVLRLLAEGSTYLRLKIRDVGSGLVVQLLGLQEGAGRRENSADEQASES